MDFDLSGRRLRTVHKPAVLMQAKVFHPESIDTTGNADPPAQQELSHLKDDGPEFAGLSPQAFPGFRVFFSSLQSRPIGISGMHVGDQPH
jgi:hypothetical protein